MFVYIPIRFCFMLIGGNLTAQLTRSHRKIEGGIQIPDRDLVASSPSFSHPTARVSRRACYRLRQVCQAEHEGIEEMMMKNIFIAIIVKQYLAYYGHSYFYNFLWTASRCIVK